MVQIDIVNDKPPGFVGNSIGVQLTKAPEEPYFKANGYLGVFDVDDISLTQPGMPMKQTWVTPSPWILLPGYAARWPGSIGLD
jgi:hypothetical protein